MTCEYHAKQRERIRRRRLDPEYREREREQQHGYRIAEDARARRRELYAGLDGYTYNRMLLRHRRNKALTRMAQRHAPKEKEA